MIRGYKCFNNDLTNCYGIKFKVGNTYTTEKEIKFGKNGNGFHMCKNIEDTLRYYDALNNEICICEVIGSGNYALYEDEYYGYYDMYSVEKLKIIKQLTREEIIKIALNLNEIRLLRFIQCFRLTPKEIELFESKYKNIDNILLAIDYYQKGNLNAYTLKKIYNNKKDK